jgi:CelD/BcsL family acetyltransferase involved in cellulose biosynthesis
MEIRVHRLSETDFAEIREGWNGLLSQSCADALFLSWEWQYSWWSCWGRPVGGDLLLLAATDSQGRLLGLAPLFIRRTRVRKVFVVRRIQFIGNDWRGIGTVRTEYIDFIARKDIHAEVVKSFLNYITAHVDFSEFVVCDIDAASETFGLLKSRAGRYSFLCRFTESDVGGTVRLDGDFRAYLSSLGGSTRASLFNHRKRMNNVSVRYADGGSIEKYLSVLSDMHRKRWNKEIFSDEQLEFHLRICRTFVSDNSLRLSVIYVDGRPVSALYNVRRGGCEYFLQSGFDPQFQRNVSLGLIHLGYAIEHAFEDGMKGFDFLVGPGQKTHYKGRLVKSERRVHTLQMIKDMKMKALYYAYDSITPIWRYTESHA